MEVSAVVLSATPVTRVIPGVAVVQHVSTFKDATGLHSARIDALAKIETPWFFFLDDDDELPQDYLRILELCTSVDTPLAYTDELVFEADGTQRVRKSQPYSQMKHIYDFTLIHHLAVCRTEAARRAARVIPRGEYGTESLLYFQVAKEGATYVPEIGYIWKRRATGLSKNPTLLFAHVASATWAYRNR